MISQKAKYALRALVALSRTRELLVIAEIAEEQTIPRKFLEQILLELKRAGLIQSRRGRFGGYQLLRPADQITFGQVLRLIDGPIAPLQCLSRIAYKRCEDCPSETECEIRRVFAVVADSMRHIFDTATIADAVAGRVPTAALAVEPEAARSPAKNAKPPLPEGVSS